MIRCAGIREYRQVAGTALYIMAHAARAWAIQKLYDGRQGMKDVKQQLSRAAKLAAAGDAPGAIKAYQGVLRRAKDNAAAHRGLGMTHLNAGAGHAAIEHLAAAARLAPHDPEVHFILGNVYLALGDAAKAVTAYEQARVLNPGVPEVPNNLGAALHQAGRSEGAILAVQEALALRPRFAEAHNTLGTILADQGEAERAADQFARALAADPKLLGAIVNQGHAFLYLGRIEDARARFAEAVAADATKAPAHNGLGLVLRVENRQAEAALGIDPQLNGALPFLAHSLMYLFRWDGLDEVVDKVLALAEANDARGPVVPPFALAGTKASPALRLKVARRSSSTAVANVAGLGGGQAFTYHREGRPRLRVGYVSPDFRQHSVAVAFKGLFDARDRQGFEWFGYSLNTPDGDSVASQFENEFDSFADISAMALRDAAIRINDDGIDVLVDLAGHTRDSRLEIFALRPAPVQAHYLGYGSTVGADFMPWLITDPVHTPPELAPHCSEALVYLPDSFMAATRATLWRRPARRFPMRP